MTFKRKEPRIYTRGELEEMSRTELNTISVSVGHMPSPDVSNDNVVNEVLAAQRIMLDKLKEQRRNEDINKVQEKVDFAKKQGKKEKAEMFEAQLSEMKASETAAVEQSVPSDDKEERVWFKVASGEGKMGKAPMFASLNGESILIKRGQWVKMKKKFLNVLNDAVVTEVEQDREGEKTLRDVPRFNYQVRSLAEGKPVETKAQSRSSF